MTIYLDVVLIENLCMNYIILFATAYVLKIKRKHLRIILSSFIGGIYSIFAYMKIAEIYSNFLIKVILSIVMIYIAYIPKDIKGLLKQLVMFYLVSFVFGGCAFALLYFIKPQEVLMRNGVLIGTYPLKIAILGGIVGFIVISIAFYVTKTKMIRKSIFCELTIFFDEKQINTVALIDTGNMLKDPITNMPVIVVEKKLLKNLLPDFILDNLKRIIGGDVPKEIYEDENLKYISRFRVIPFKSLGKENGLLLGFKINKILVNMNDEQINIENVIIGIYEGILSRNSKYFALIGLDVIEGSDNSEFIKDTSGKY